MIIVIPLAGRGSRFSGSSHDIPKPFIPAGGRPMLARAYESVAAFPATDVVFVALAEHAARFGLRKLATSLAGDRARVVEIPAVTEGQLCTVLAAREFLDTDDDLLIASSDTWVESAIGEAIAGRRPECRGIISVARLPGDHWSFVAVDANDRVTQVAEKVRISPFASTGLYHFSSAREFVDAGDAMVAAGERTRGEFYVIPVYQRFLSQGLQIRISEARQVWDMGNPAALQAFESHLANEGVRAS